MSTSAGKNDPGQETVELNREKIVESRGREGVIERGGREERDKNFCAGFILRAGISFPM